MEIQLDQESIYLKVKEVIEDALQNRPVEITPTSNLIEDLKADSLAIVTMAYSLEDELAVEIPDTDLEQLTTVDSVVQYILRRLQQ